MASDMTLVSISPASFLILPPIRGPYLPVGQVKTPNIAPLPVWEVEYVE